MSKKTKKTKKKSKWHQTEEKLALARETARELPTMLNRAEPIDPFAIAEEERPLLRVIRGDFRERFDGQLEFHPEKRRFLMFVNTRYDTSTRHHHPRTRFSAAHELGHYFIHHHRASLLKGALPHASHSEFTSSVLMEREADAFAAELLMPQHLMSPLVNNKPLKRSIVRDLSKRFQTSAVTTTIRAVRLSDFPAAALGISKGSIAWFAQSSCLAKAGCYPPPRRRIQSPTALERWHSFMTGKYVHAHGESVVAHWFNTYRREHLEPIPVQEYYLPVGSMRTLVVLLTVSEDDLFPEEHVEGEDGVWPGDPQWEWYHESDGL